MGARKAVFPGPDLYAGLDAQILSRTRKKAGNPPGRGDKGLNQSRLAASTETLQFFPVRQFLH